LGERMQLAAVGYEAGAGMRMDVAAHPRPAWAGELIACWLMALGPRRRRSMFLADIVGVFP
jgi:hypothetical protein